MNAPAIRLDLLHPRLRVVESGINKNAPDLAEGGVDEPVKFVKKDKPTPSTEQDDRECPEELVAAIASQFQELGIKEGHPLRVLFEKLYLLAADPSHSNDSGGVPNGTETRRGREADRLEVRKPQRHDGRRSPDGFRFIDGFLWKLPNAKAEAESPKASEVAKTILLGLASWFHVPDNSEKVTFLSNAIYELVQRSEFLPTLQDRMSGLLKGYESIVGRRYGEPSWIRALEVSLERKLYQMTVARIRGGRQGKETLPSPEELQQLLTALRSHYPNLPDWLDSESVGQILERGTLSRAGGGKRRIGDVIREIVAKVGRGNSDT